MRRIGLLFGFALLACVRANPAFDIDELGDESDETERGDGDGDSGDGDGEPGDGDGEPGDGDGEPGDGDGEPGDGDGEPGDGDGEPGDGDGDAESDTGDGDGDNNRCEPGSLDDATPAVISGSLTVDASAAPGFDEHDLDCQVLVICNGEQELCNTQTPYLVQLSSGGFTLPGVVLMEPVPIRVHFQPGKPSCGMPPLILDPTQYLEISWFGGNNLPEVIQVRLPCFEGTELDLWVAADGSTFYDEQLLEEAATW